jgi:hypothetical protein
MVLFGWPVSLGKKCTSGMNFKLTRVNETWLAVTDPGYLGVG